MIAVQFSFCEEWKTLILMCIILSITSWRELLIELGRQQCKHVSYDTILNFTYSLGPGMLPEVIVVISGRLYAYIQNKHWK